MKDKKTILILDDLEVKGTILFEFLSKNFYVIETFNDNKTIDIIDRFKESIDAVIINMAETTTYGFTLLDYMVDQGMKDLFPIIVILDENMSSYELRAYQSGAEYVLTQPINPRVLNHSLENWINRYSDTRSLKNILKKQSEVLTQQSLRFDDFNSNIIDGLSTLIEFSHGESKRHIDNICYFTRILLLSLKEHYKGYQLNDMTIEMISKCAALHDIGKMAIPDSILLKPGKLTKAEYERMKSHTTMGWQILQDFNCITNRIYLQYCYEICYYHHERWDGAGYPFGLAGEEIPISAQVVALVDVYDALTSKRVYKDAYSHEIAVAMIVNGKCGTFSPKVLKCFKMEEELFKERTNQYITTDIIVKERQVIS